VERCKNQFVLGIERSGEEVGVVKDQLRSCLVGIGRH